MARMSRVARLRRLKGDLAAEKSPESHDTLPRETHDFNRPTTLFC